MGWLDEWMPSVAPVSSDDAYQTHRAKANFQNSLTGQEIRLQQAEAAKQPVKVLKKGETDTRTQDLPTGGVDLQTGRPVGEPPTLSFNDIERAKAEAEVNRQAKLQQSFDTSTAAHPATLDYETPAKAVRGAIAKKINETRGTQLTEETVTDYLAKGIDDTSDPVSQAVYSLATSLATDPLTYLPEVGLASTVDFQRGAASLFKGLEQLKGAYQASHLGNETGAINTRLLTGDVFYSPTERVVQAKLPDNVTPEQVKATIANSGVSMDEYEWMDLDEFMKGKPTVKKQDLLDYIDAHKIEVKEVELTKESNASVRQKQPFNEWYAQQEDKPTTTAATLRSSERERWEIRYNDAMQREAVNADNTKFSSYTLPGGTNYREVLLTLPAKQPIPVETREGTGDKANFISSHFDQPNILVHMRVNDRVDGDGKRTLFIEEIQSDWHQKGRTEGYNQLNKGRDITAIDKEMDALHDRGDINADPALGAEYERLSQERMTLQNRGSVPDAPFKRTDQWVSLAVKRMIREAAENGYERIAWTTGAQQAERYDLSKQLSSLKATRSGMAGPAGDTVHLVAYGKDGEQVLNRRVPTSELPDTVGKELAEKIVKQSAGDEFDYSGLDLQVGGEGMHTFYDDMLPKTVNKLVKKWGGKVETTPVNVGKVTHDVNSVTITPDMTRAVLNNPQSLFGGAFQTVEDYLSTLPRMVREKLAAKLPVSKADSTLANEQGRISMGPALFLTRAALGAAGGAIAGDEENAIRNALLGAGLGAFAPQLAKGLAGAMRGAKAALKGTPVEGVKPASEMPAAYGEPIQGVENFQAKYAKLVDEQRRGVRHDADVSQEADILRDSARVSKETIQNLAPGTTLNDADLTAAERVLTESGLQLLNLVDAPDEQFLEAFLTHAFLLDPKVRGVEAESGRALRVLGQDAPLNMQAERAFHEELRRVMDEMKAGATVGQLREYVRRVRTPEELAVFSRNVVKPGFKDAFIPLVVNSWLTGSQSHFWNLLGNTANLSLATFDRAIAGLEGGAVRPTEFLHLIHGMFAGMGDAFSLAAVGDFGPAWDLAKASTPGQAIRGVGNVALKGREASKFETGVMEAEKVRPSFTEVARLGPFGHALDYLSAFMEGAGGRLLSVGDEFFKTVSLQAHIYARTMRDAYRQAEVEMTANRLNGKSLNARAQELLTEYRHNIPQDVMDDAKKFAAEVTMTTPLGDFGRWLQEGANRFTTVKLIAPFLQAPTNIFKSVGHHSPAGVFATRYQEDVAAGGARAELARAKVATGSMIAGIAALWAADGLITGTGPDPKKFPELRKAMKEGGWEPCSLNVSAIKRKAAGKSPAWQEGDEFKRVDRIAPVGQIMCMAADYADAVMNNAHESIDEYEEMAHTLLASTVHVLGQAPFIQGFSQVALGFAYPESHLDKTVTNQLVSLTPVAGSGLARQVTKLGDPVIREANGYFENILKNTPGFSKNLPAALHPITGEEVTNWPPFKSQYRADLVDDAITANMVNVSTKPTVIDGIKLTKREQHDLQETIVSTKSPETGIVLYDALADLIERNPDYNGKNQKDGDGTLRNAMLSRMIQGYVDLGKATYKLEHEDFQRKVKERAVDKAAQILGTATVAGQ